MAQSKPQSTHTLIPEDHIQPDNISMTSVESDTSPEIPPADSTPNQARLRAELDRSLLSQHRWLLMSQGEKVEKELMDEMDAAQEALRQARQAEERRKLEELRLAEEKRYIICMHTHTRMYACMHAHTDTHYLISNATFLNNCASLQIINSNLWF